MAKTKEIQLEIAAQWLEETALLLSALERREEADNLRRVASDCLLMSRAK